MKTQNNFYEGQIRTSKNTSINTSKLPAIYNKIDWEQFKGQRVFDYGCGKIETVRNIMKFLEPYDITLIPYDKFNLPSDYNRSSLQKIWQADVFICSNTLNVIDSDFIVQDIIAEITYNATHISRIHPKPFFFTIYEGDKSGQQKESQDDCWQRNWKTEDYITYFNWYYTFPIKYKGCITIPSAKQYFKRSIKK